MPQVEWYDPQSEAGLLLTAARQVKQHKARRGQGAAKPPWERETRRVHTDVWLVAPPPGGCPSLTAGVAATGQEVVSGTARVRWQCQRDDAGRAEPLAVVASTEGARTMRRQVAELCGQPVPVILDWYPLDKQVGEWRSQVARPQPEKAVHVAPLLDHLGHGRTDTALTDLRREVQAKNPQ
jgi:hypothetical protein